ncbi:phosphatidylglycerophosphatase A [Wenzhouxiangella sp. AB-CW3]|uniref:phosphatidylglycerophosphatase A family protein n=1 Tax=Wenzhouxiangella sp. AB-CW3 TaxID=2771012 RepID=UPI001CC2B6B7|nr:phosphatidylglycerophosphatase A [Wenzhouxiangella sp. AB-CW3]
MNRADTRQIALATPTGFLAFGFGSGLAPVAPGTAGTIASLPFAALIVQLPFSVALAVVIAGFLIGVPLCGIIGKKLGVHDHGGIVWDEFVGMWLVLLFVPFHWGWWLAAFVLFRIFDAAKPWPIRWFDRRVHGGFGVMLDDALAAGFTLLVLVPAMYWLSAG